MKGFISVDIPTKNYIKAYLIARLGERPILSRDNVFGNKLFDLLQHSVNPERKQFSSKRYPTTIRVYITMSVYRQRGYNLNETNIKNFNRFVELLIKQRFYELMDDAIDILPSFEANLPYVRNKLGIDIESWADDSMSKDYYRYRLSNGKPLFYNKKSSRTVLSEKADGIAF